MLTIDLRIPEAFVPRARYALETLALAWGVPIRIGDPPAGEDADLIYGGVPEGVSHHRAVVVPFDPAVYEPATACVVTPIDGAVVWAPEGVAAPLADVIGGAFRLLTFLDESQVEESRRDRRGIFGCSALPEARRGVTGVPLVEHHAWRLLEALRARRPGIEDARRPRWPRGKRYAAVFTHDTDAVRIGALAEIFTNVAKSVLRGDPVSLEMVRLGLRHGADVAGNPLFGFPGWRDWESERGLRSAFYLFALPPGKRHDLNDCKSSVLDPRVDWGILRAMAGRGWEFGVHAPIHAKDDLDILIWCKRTLEDRLGGPIFGMRHHYWALDWRRPHLTFRKHVNAGFRYDASIAWRDLPGFRAGTSLPFRPFDPGRERALDLYELPSSMMDGHVIANLGAGPMREAAAGLFERVRAAGGMVVLDWHTEAACDALRYRNHRTYLGGLIEPLLADEAWWIATPWEVVQHWHRRRIELASTAPIELDHPAGDPRGAPARLRIGLLGMPDNASTPALLAELARNGMRVEVVIYWRPSARDQYRRALRSLRAAGPGGVLSRVRRALARPGSRAAGAQGPASPRSYFVPHHNSEECRKILSDERVDILIVATDAILTRKIFRTPRLATLNAHPGWAPAFRGLGSAYAQLRQGLMPAVTVHQVDEGIDTGPVYARESLDVSALRPEDLEAELIKLRGRLLADVIRRFERGEARPLEVGLEPSNMTRGIPARERKAIERRMARGEIRRQRPA